MTTPAQAIAVIDGELCQLARDGARMGGHQPLATAVVEFHPGPMCYFVREHPYGLLPGLPNLYCLDGALRLQWMAEWPDASDPCAGILGCEGGLVLAVSARGTTVRLDAATGRLVRADVAMPAAG